jgi:hypothetical protein
MFVKEPKQLKTERVSIRVSFLRVKKQGTFLRIAILSHEAGWLVLIPWE